MRRDPVWPEHLRQRPGRERLAVPVGPRCFVAVVQPVEQRLRGDPVVVEYGPDVGEQPDAGRLVLDLTAAVELHHRAACTVGPVGMVGDREQRLGGVLGAIVQL